jgi:hypothetical protein
MGERSRRRGFHRPRNLVHNVKVGRVFTAVVIVAAAVFCGGCGDTAILDQSPIGNFVVVPIVNDTQSTIEVTLCYRARCKSHDITDQLAPGTSRRDGVNNAEAGVAIFRVKTNAGIRCLRMRYASGQEHHAPLAISSSGRCPWQ